MFKTYRSYQRLLILTAGLILFTPAQAVQTQHLSSKTKSHPHWQTITIKPGDNLAKIFSHNQLKQQQLQQILTLPQAKNYLAHMHLNNKIRLFVDGQNQLQQLDYPVSKTATLSIQRHGSGFQEQLTQTNAPVIAKQELPQAAKEVQLVQNLLPISKSGKPAKAAVPAPSPYNQAAGTIHSSLHLAIKRLGLPSSTTQQLLAIFKEQVDLEHSVHPGDQFQILYQPLSAKPGKSPSIQILAAKFTTHDKSYEVVRFEQPKGHFAYYRPDGKSMKSGFIRIPVDHARISSGFSLNRLDPIFNVVRPHLGVDLAAPCGTPIKASSDGRIIFLGQKNGYGNTIIIKRDEHYSTLYAHLHAFTENLHAGSTVQQGQIIGEVGSNGHSTGPHLHYEFWVDGARRDPLSVELPKGFAIPRNYLAKFTSQAHYLLAQLETPQHIQFAANTAKKTNKSRV